MVTSHVLTFYRIKIFYFSYSIQLYYKFLPVTQVLFWFFQPEAHE